MLSITRCIPKTVYALNSPQLQIYTPLRSIILELEKTALSVVRNNGSVNNNYTS